MPAFLAMLGGMLLSMARKYLPGIVGRVLLAFGIGIFTQEVAMPALIGLAQQYVGQLPPLALAYFGALGLDKCVTIVLSAHAAVATQKVLLRKLTTS